MKIIYLSTFCANCVCTYVWYWYVCMLLHCTYRCQQVGELFLKQQNNAVAAANTNSDDDDMEY